MKTRLFGKRNLIAIAVFVLSCYLQASAQYLDQTGSPTFTTAEPVELGFINLANGNLHLEIPLYVSPQRGSLGFTGKLIYDSRIWKKVGTTWQPTNVPNSQGGWRFASSADRGLVTYTYTSELCGEPPHAGSTVTYGGFKWTDATGTSHSFGISTFRDVGCGDVDDPTGDALASDSSGYHMYVTNFTNAKVYARDGTQVYPILKDTNGNYFSTDANGNGIDTLGRTPVLKTVNGSQTYYDILDSQNSNPRPRITVTTTTINVNTAFGQSGVTEYAGTLTVIQSVALPDGTSYTFDYDSGTTAGKYGLLKTITLPTGAQIAYTHTTFTDAYANKNRWVNTRAVGGGTWTYTPAVITSCGTSCSQKVTITKPTATSDQMVYTFTMNNGAWNSDTKVYTGSAATGTLLMTLLTDYDFSQAGSNYIRMVRNTTTLPRPGGNISKKTEYLYDTPQNANLTSIKEWNYYSGTPSATPDRKTDITYLATSGYTAKNIINKPLTVTTRTGAGTWLSQTNYTYDSTTLTSITGVTQHDDAGFGTGNTTRGNLTVVQQYAASAGSCVSPNCLSTTMTYDTTGQLRQVTDPKGNIAATLSYTDNFFHDNGSNPPQAYTPPAPTNAYLTSITPPLIGAATLGYYFNTGKRAKSVDQNGADTYAHYIDSLDRLTHTYGPLLGGNRPWNLIQHVSATQTDSYAAVADATPSPACTSCVHQQLTGDALGRVTRSNLINDPEGSTKVDTAYSAGRVQNVSTAYRSTGDPSYGLETPAYDGADRVTRITHQDASFVQAFYGAAVSGGGGASSQLCASATYGLGFPLLYVDEAGKRRQFWLDGLGRTIEADEPDAGGTLNLNTCYKYDLLDNLKEVNQGAQTRTYSYDGLSRLTVSATPEAGSVSLYYTTSGGALCAGTVSSVCRRTDARAITTTYAYDAFNRLTSVTYSDTTPPRSFFYDQTTYNGLTITNGKGRRTGMSDGSGLTAWSYDAAGRVLAERRTINGSPNVTKTISYTYNLDSSVATITYPSGRVITYTYSAIGRPLTAKDIANNINYATDALFAPHGALASLKNGVVTGGFAGITTTNSYNNRLQATLLSAATPTQTIFSLGYAFGTSDNNQIASITNNLASGRSQSFTYDTLRRLSAAQSQATSGADCWGQSFGYDRWANLPTATVTKCSAPSQSLTVSTATNRITNSGFTYNNSGDLTNENGPAYTWDAEERLTSAAGVTYTYDADGLRVKKSNGKLYWRNIGIDALAESDLNGNATAEFVYFAGRRVAMRDGAGNVYYILADHLGSARLVTDPNGNVCRDVDYFPFGGEKITLNTCPSYNYKFAGYERDSESGLDYAIFRYYNSRLGRFMSPDLLAGSAGDPQSLNRYAYVDNDSINRIDPAGLCTVVIGGGGQEPGTASTATQQFFAQEAGAIEVFPYSNLTPVETLPAWNSEENGPTQSTATVVAAINYAAQSNPGDPIDVVTASAGAQAFNTAVDYLSDDVKARINNVVYVSPASPIGSPLLRSGNGSTSVFQGSIDPVDALLGQNAPPGAAVSSTTQCAHHMTCVFMEYWKQIREKSTKPCITRASLNAGGKGEHYNYGNWYPVYSTFCGSEGCTTYVWWIWLTGPQGPHRE